jgi:hypothetical protein
MLLITANWNPGGSGGVYNDHPVGVYYTGSQWAIFNQDLKPIPAGRRSILRSLARLKPLFTRHDRKPSHPTSLYGSAAEGAVTKAR